MVAEGVGFEPMREREPPAGFQDRCLKPLGHPSNSERSRVGHSGPENGLAIVAALDIAGSAAPRLLRTYVEAAAAVETIRLLEVLHRARNQGICQADMPILVGFHPHSEQPSSLRSQVLRVGHDRQQKRTARKGGKAPC